MNKTIAAFATLVALGAGAQGVKAIDLKGSETLKKLTLQVVAACPGATGVVNYVGQGSGPGENAMIAGAQAIFPMTRFLAGTGTGGVCVLDTSKAEAIEIGGDSIVVTMSATHHAACDPNQGGTQDNASAGVQSPPVGGASSDEPSDAAASPPSEVGTADSRAGAGGEAPDLSPGSPTGGSAEQAGAEMAGEDAGGALSQVIPTGTHLCTGPSDCVGQVECRGQTRSMIRVCLKGCTSDADCSSSHRCVLPTAPLAPDAAGCFLRCDASPLICPYAFDCYDISGNQDYTCLPRQW